jgi:Flp pilus assembly protein TadG
MLTMAKPHRERGVAVVEFGIVLVPLMLMVFGITEFGRAMYEYNTLVKATRNAARFLSAFDPADAAYPVSEAKCLAVYGNNSCTGGPLAQGLTTGKVFICDRANSTSCPGETLNSFDTGSGPINLVKVKISGYSFTSLVPFATGFTTITFDDISTVMKQI